MPSLELYYLQDISLKDISLDDLSMELNAYWEQLRDENSPISEYAYAAGLTTGQIEKAIKYKREEALFLAPGHAGLGVIETTIIVSSIPLIAKIAEGLWEKVFLPKIEAKYGPNAIKKLNGSSKTTAVKKVRQKGKP